jgi:hypothetical protein
MLRKSVQWEPSCFMQKDIHRQTDGQTNMMNLTASFSNFANALNKDRHKNPFKLQRKLLETNIIITST